jgi:hypothetical protein
MHHLVLAAADWGRVWHDTWRIATSVIVLFLILAWWNWLMKNLGTF